MARARRVLARRFRLGESGGTAIEYGLLAAMITIFLVALAGAGGAVDMIYVKLMAIVAAMAAAG